MAALSLGIALTVSAQAYSEPSASADAPWLVPECGVSTYGLCGYAQWDPGARNKSEIVIPAKFESAGSFVDGLAVVRAGGLYGYIDSTGQYVIEPQFEGASSFLHDLALVVSDGRIGVIDRRGAYVVPPRFARAAIWNKNTLMASDGANPDYATSHSGNKTSGPILRLNLGGSS